MLQWPCWKAAATQGDVSGSEASMLLRSALTLISDWLSWTVVGTLEQMPMEEVALVAHALEKVRLRRDSNLLCQVHQCWSDTICSTTRLGSAAAKYAWMELLACVVCTVSFTLNGQLVLQHGRVLLTYQVDINY